MDQDPNAIFKSAFKGHRARSMAQDVFDQLNKGMSPMDVKMDFTWTAQKEPFKAALEHAILAVQPKVVRYGLEKVGYLKAWTPGTCARIGCGNLCLGT